MEVRKENAVQPDHIGARDWREAGIMKFSARMKAVLQLSLFFTTTVSVIAQVAWQEGFEGIPSGWSIEGSTNVWQIGVPTSGPGIAHSGTNVAATRLSGAYPDNVDSRLVS